MNTQTNLNSKLEKHSAAINTITLFSGLKREAVTAELEKRVHA
jgi:hypothetical protein